ncbi:MAG: hypothetical protein VB102_03465 [Paludibacter sp.]|nr:hypothetical protein [Paludibacter sp.]
MKSKLRLLILLSLIIFITKAQDIPQHIAYFRIYDFLDELANDGFIGINSSVKPYSRSYIAQKLVEAKQIDDLRTQQKNKLSKRQQAEIKFFMNEYALELNKLPESKLTISNSNKGKLAFIPPAYHYKDSVFRARITPLLGMHLYFNQNGKIDKRWYGAEFQGMIGKNLSVYGSLRDISHSGDGLLSGSSYLNDEPGYEYTVGTDYSDSRGGIKYANDYFSIGLMKDNVVWGDNYHGSNILSGRTPSFPMIYLRLQPAKWFELNYFHGWLVSNVPDSTNYYLENNTQIYYRQVNKFIAANMLTFTPVKNLHLSVGNSIVYAERNVHPAYFIPIAFYKSIDHTLTKGIATQNQNSQVFFNFSSRNIRHLHLFTSIFFDEVQFRRFLPDSPDKNPVSYKIGANLSNFPLKNLSAIIEFTRTNILNYKQSVPTLTWASNSYNLGHYLGDNAQELYAALSYKPFRGMDIQLSFLDAKHGNEYEYIRSGFFNGIKSDVIDIISNPSPGDIIWSNRTVGFKATYEVFQNAYAIVNIENSNIQGFDATTPVVFGEQRMTAQEALNRYTPAFMQGQNTTLTLGFGFGF